MCDSDIIADATDSIHDAMSTLLQVICEQSEPRCALEEPPCLPVAGFLHHLARLGSPRARPGHTKSPFHQAVQCSHACLKRKNALTETEGPCLAYLVQSESSLAAHVLEQQLGDLQMLPMTGVVQGRVASLQAKGNMNT